MYEDILRCSILIGLNMATFVGAYVITTFIINIA